MTLSCAEKRARLEKALAYGGGTHTVDDVVKLVADGRAQFWANEDGAIITEVHNFPRLKAVNFWLISGELRDCLALEDDVLAWAKNEGCTVATATGRKGWGRVAAPTGWRPHMYTFYKVLSHV